MNFKPNMCCPKCGEVTNNLHIKYNKDEDNLIIKCRRCEFTFKCNPIHSEKDLSENIQKRNYKKFMDDIAPDRKFETPTSWDEYRKCFPFNEGYYLNNNISDQFNTRRIPVKIVVSEE